MSKVIGQKQVPISSLKCWEKNPRAVLEKDFERLKKQIKKLGVYVPLVINEDNIVLSGNMRLRAYADLGIDPVWVTIVEASDEATMLEYALSGNDRVGYYEDDKLAELIQLNGINLDLELYKVDLKVPQLDLRDVLEQFGPGPEEVEAPPVPEKAVSVAGKVYQLGKHRLLCGDATKKENVEQLMNGKKADMVFTDPPYGISVVETSPHLSGKYPLNKGKIGFSAKWNNSKPKALDYSPVIGDDKPFDPTFLLNQAPIIILFGANNYASRLPDQAHWLIWDKHNNMEVLDHHFFGDAELLWTNVPNRKGVRIYRFLWKGLFQEGTREKRVHPTQKPTGLLVNIIKDYSEEQWVIQDLFGGSGSTLIACEQLGRICYMMEIDPRYCDVIRKRYARTIGQEEKWEEITPAVEPSSNG